MLTAPVKENSNVTITCRFTEDKNATRVRFRTKKGRMIVIFFNHPRHCLTDIQNPQYQWHCFGASVRLELPPGMYRHNEKWSCEVVKSRNHGDEIVYSQRWKPIHVSIGDTATSNVSGNITAGRPADLVCKLLNTGIVRNINTIRWRNLDTPRKVLLSVSKCPSTVHTLHGFGCRILHNTEFQLTLPPNQLKQGDRWQCQFDTTVGATKFSNVVEINLKVNKPFLKCRRTEVIVKSEASVGNCVFIPSGYLRLTLHKKFIFHSITFSLEPVTNKCPDDGFNFTLSAVKMRCYWFVKTRHSWDQANQICLRGGGTLAIVDNSAQDNGVEMYLKKFIPKREEYVWLGFSDKEDDNVFMNANNVPQTYLPWAPANPDANSKQCGSKNTMYKDWHDLGCSSLKYALCSKDLQRNYTAIIDPDVRNNLQVIVWDEYVEQCRMDGTALDCIIDSKFCVNCSSNNTVIGNYVKIPKIDALICNMTIKGFPCFELGQYDYGICSYNWNYSFIDDITQSHSISDASSTTILEATHEFTTHQQNTFYHETSAPALDTSYNILPQYPSVSNTNAKGLDTSYGFITRFQSKPNFASGTLDASYDVTAKYFNVFDISTQFLDSSHDASTPFLETQNDIGTQFLYSSYDSSTQFIDVSYEPVLTTKPDLTLQTTTTTVPTTTNRYSSSDAMSQSTMIPSPTLCLCDCRLIRSLSDEELQGKIDALIKTLKIDAKKTSAARRKLISENDERPVTKTIGTVAIGVLCTVFGLIFVNDLLRLWKWLIDEL